MNIKKSVKVLKSKVLQKWGNVKEEDQEKIVDLLDTIFKFLQTSFLFSFPISLTLNFFYVVKLKDYFIIVLILWTILPIIEHYYVWFREDWKRQIVEEP